LVVKLDMSMSFELLYESETHNWMVLE
jgi:hypothetical protein